MLLLRSQLPLDALIRSLAPAAWFRQGVGITVTGSGVSQWDDISGNGRHLLQGTDAARPALQADGSVLFNSTSHYLKCNAFTLTQPACVLWVGKQAAWTSGDYLFDIGSAAGGAAVIQQGVTPELRMFAGISLSRTQAAIGSIVVVASVFNGASSLFGINGANTTGNSGANALGNFSVGAASNGVGSSASQVYETVIFPIAPSTAQLDRLVAGLMARHGVA